MSKTPIILLITTFFLFQTGHAKTKNTFEMPYLVTNKVLDLVTDVRYFRVDFTMNEKIEEFDNRISLMGYHSPKTLQFIQEKVVSGYPGRLPLNRVLRPGKNELIFKLTPTLIKDQPLEAYASPHSIWSLDKMHADFAIIEGDEESMSLTVDEWKKPAKKGVHQRKVVLSTHWRPKKVEELKPVTLNLTFDTSKLGLKLEKIPAKLCYTEVDTDGFEGKVFLNGKKLADTLGFTGQSYVADRPNIKNGQNIFSTKVSKLDPQTKNPTATLRLVCRLKAYKTALQTERYLGHWPDDDLKLDVIETLLKKTGQHSTSFIFKP